MQIQLQIQQLHIALEEERDTLTKADMQPSRTRHLADLVVVAVRQLREEEAEAAALCRVHDAAEEAHIQVGAPKDGGCVVPLRATRP